MWMANKKVGKTLGANLFGAVIDEANFNPGWEKMVGQIFSVPVGVRMKVRGSGYSWKRELAEVQEIRGHRTAVVKLLKTGEIRIVELRHIMEVSALEALADQA